MSDPLFDPFKLNINLYKGMSGEPLEEPKPLSEQPQKQQQTITLDKKPILDAHSQLRADIYTSKLYR